MLPLVPVWGFAPLGQGASKACAKKPSRMSGVAGQPERLKSKRPGLQAFVSLHNIHYPKLYKYWLAGFGIGKSSPAWAHAAWRSRPSVRLAVDGPIY